MRPSDPVFNPQKRRLRRTRISRTETGAGVIILCLLALVFVWFASKRDDYNPAERDISPELLAQGSVSDTLYRTPVQRWVEPGQAAIAGAPPALGIFPPALLSDGWEPASRLQEFNKDTLYEKIDGAAEQYFQFGFKMLHYLTLAKPAQELEISVELYDMESFQNALGIFAAQKDAGKAIERIGKAQCYATGAGYIGLFENFYFKLVGNNPSPAIQDAARKMAETLAQINTGTAQTPVPFTIFTEKMNIPFERIAYEKQDVFQYDFAKDFWFAQAEPDKDTRFYMHAAASPEDASALFDKLLQNHLLDYDLVEQKTDDVILKHKFLSTFMTLNRHAVILFGLDNVPDQAAIEAPLRALRTALDVETPSLEQ